MKSQGSRKQNEQNWRKLIEKCKSTYQLTISTKLIDMKNLDNLIQINTGNLFSVALLISNSI